MGGSTIQEVAALHASMVSQPEVATQLILAAVEATTSPKLLGGGTPLAALTWAFASSTVMSSGYMT